MESLNNDFVENKPVLNNLLIMVMAIACGLTVANLYYIQPLLADIAKTFNVSEIKCRLCSNAYTNRICSWNDIYIAP